MVFNQIVEGAFLLEKNPVRKVDFKNRRQNLVKKK